MSENLKTELEAAPSTVLGPNILVMFACIFFYQFLAKLFLETTGQVGFLSSLVPGFFWPLFFWGWAYLIYRTYENIKISLLLVGSLSR